MAERKGAVEIFARLLPALTCTTTFTSGTRRPQIRGVDGMELCIRPFPRMASTSAPPSSALHVGPRVCHRRLGGAHAPRVGLRSYLGGSLSLLLGQHTKIVPETRLSRYSPLSAGSCGRFRPLIIRMCELRHTVGAGAVNL